MAQFDVHRLTNGRQLVLDCQSDLHDEFATRFVVPLVPLNASPPRAGRLHPLFRVQGDGYVMATQGATALRRTELGPVIANLAEHRLTIVGALDLLITGV
ncbi:MAG: hypothetical protein B7Z08_06045 [Sphingomonadales bacterium 32-68-7]|nr:MAG: hypothetical protein B7Z33_04595 [Sphingomonadales bacterium 12-68-11]OYX09241.1 MAG: hypothetical protein B7Z08_06045 [Sphingomonadales bacterium 32-68-7]